MALRWGDRVNLARLSRFFAEEARIPASPRAEREGRGEYVISDAVLNQTNFDFNFIPQRMAIDAVLSEA